MDYLWRDGVDYDWRAVLMRLWMWWTWGRSQRWFLDLVGVFVHLERGGAGALNLSSWRSVHAKFLGQLREREGEILRK